MAITDVYDDQDGQNATSVTVHWPPAGALSVGDVAYLMWTYQTSATGVTNPSGFTQRASSNMSSGAGTTRILTRVIDGSETAGGAVTCSASSNKMTLTLVIRRGIDPAHPIDTSGVQVFAETTSRTTHPSPSVTPSAAGCAIMIGIAERSSTGTSTYTPPVGYTKRAEGVTTAAGMTITATADDLSAHTAGAPVTPGSWTSSNSFATANVQTFTWAVPAIATTTVTGSAALSGTGSLVGSALASQLAAAGLSGAGAATASGLTQVRASPPLFAVGTMTVTGHVQQRGGASLAGSGAVTVAGLLTSIAAPVLFAHGDLSATGLVTRFAVSALTGHDTLTAEVSGEVAASADLDAAGTLTVSGYRTASAAATLSAGSTLAASGNAIRTAVVAMSGLGALAVDGGAHVYASTAFSAAGSLSAATDGAPITRGHLTLLSRPRPRVHAATGSASAIRPAPGSAPALANRDRRLSTIGETP